MPGRPGAAVGHTPEEDKRRWEILRRLSDNGDVEGFYREYASYLEWAGVHSDSRRALLRMALAATEMATKADWDQL